MNSKIIIKLNKKTMLAGGALAMLLGYAVAQASGIFIPPRPPAIKKPGASKCEPADSDKCKAEKK